MKLLTLRRQLQQIFSKSTLQAFYYPKPVVFEPSRFSDYQTKIALDVYEHHKDRQFKEIQSSITPKSLATEITDMMDHPFKQFQIWVDSFGCIQVKANNNLLQNYVNSILTSNKFAPYMTQTYLSSKIPPTPINHKIIFPIIDILKQISANDYRHWMHLQSIARIHQFFNDSVKRVSVVSNNLPFHGIVFKYMSQNPGQPALMQNIAQYLKDSGVDTMQQITKMGSKMLNDITNNQEMYNVLQQITKQKFNQVTDLFDCGKTQKLKSRQLKKQYPMDIISQLCKQKNVIHHISCERHKIVEMQSMDLIKQNHLNFVIHKIGELEKGEDPVQNLFKSLNNSVQQRLKLNIPQFQGKIQKHQKKWLNYLLSSIPISEHLSIDPEQVTNLIFTKSDELLSLHEKTNKMIPGPFKISCQADRKLALLAIEVINSLQRYNISHVHSLLNRYATISKKHETFAGNRLLELMLEEVYKIDCLL